MPAAEPESKPGDSATTTAAAVQVTASLPGSSQKYIQQMNNEGLAAAVASADKAFQKFNDERLVSCAAAQCEKLTAAHQSALEDALHDTCWSAFAEGAFDEQYLLDLLHLRLTLEQLLDDKVSPHYGLMLQAMERLQKMVDNPRTLTHFRDVASRILSQLKDLELQFARSQVQIDTMNHEPFFATIADLQTFTEQSMEYLVQGHDETIAARVAEYQKLLEAQLTAYNDEAATVAAAPSARLRASRPEDDADPWETHAAAKQPSYSSAALQQWALQESADRVAEIPEDEWYFHHRRDVETLIPRGKRILKEVDEEAFRRGLECLVDIISRCEEKGAIIDQTAKDSGESSKKMLAMLEERRKQIEAVGTEFQAQCSEMRKKCESDILSLEVYRDKSTEADSEARSKYKKAVAEDLEHLRSNKTHVDRLAAEIEERQRRIEELRLERSTMTKETLRRLQEEEQRSSKHRVLMEVAERYIGRLRASLNNYLLPEGYNAILADFPRQSCLAAESKAASERQLLADLLHKATREYAQFAATTVHAAEVGLLRKQEKVNDLLAKALISQRQREFCEQTKDPNYSKHKDTESMLRDMANKLAAGLAPLQLLSQSTLEKYNSVVALAQQLSIDVATQDPMTLVSNSASTHRDFIRKAPRAPFTSLDFSSNQRLVRPEKFFIDDSPQRARR